MKKQSRKTFGFTLAETLIGVALLAVFILGVGSFSAHQSWQMSQERMKGNLSAVKARLLQTITSDGAWMRSVQVATAASNLGCIGSAPGCAGLPGPYDFDLYQSDGSLVYSGSSMGGYQLNGSACSTPVGCPIQLSLKWSPSCSASDTNCRSPLIQVAGTFSSSVLASTLNLAKYSFTLNRSPISMAACAATPPPACGAGQVAVCRPTGWACVTTNAPYCLGSVSWNDSGTSYGPCSATVLAPGVLHNTYSTIATTAPSTVGSANFLCIPGQPMNGFILQPGATCSASALPIAGVCGGANGNGYAAAAAATAAGTCTAGTLSASLIDPGPWTWICNGISGGTSAPCAAGFNGTCGSANGNTFASAATANAAGLCLSGAASPGSVSGAGPWSWNCTGSGVGHTDASCTASSGVPSCTSPFVTAGLGELSTSQPGCYCPGSGERYYPVFGTCEIPACQKTGTTDDAAYISMTYGTYSIGPQAPGTCPFPSMYFDAANPGNVSLENGHQGWDCYRCGPGSTAVTCYPDSTCIAPPPPPSVCPVGSSPMGILFIDESTCLGVGGGCPGGHAYVGVCSNFPGNSQGCCL